MKHLATFLLIAMACLFSLVGCNGTDNASASQGDGAPSRGSVPELEETDWQAVSADAEAFGLTGGYGNPKFENVFSNTDTVPLDQLVAFSLVADGLSEGACEELRSRFLEAPNTVLTYLVLMGDQRVDFWDDLPAAEAICQFIASADAAWHGGTEEFVQTMADCREWFPEGRAAELLDVMEAEYEECMEQNMQ